MPKRAGMNSIPGMLNGPTPLIAEGVWMAQNLPMALPTAPRTPRRAFQIGIAAQQVVGGKQAQQGWDGTPNP